MDTNKLIGYGAVVCGLILVVIGAAHASHYAQTLVGLGVVIGGAGWYVAKKDLPLLPPPRL